VQSVWLGKRANFVAEARTIPRVHQAKRVCVGDIMVNVVTHSSLAEMMRDDVLDQARSGRALAPKLVFSANGQSVSMYYRDLEFRRLFRQGDIVHADGMSVLRAAHWLTKTGLPERVATSDFFEHAAKAASAARVSFFLLGGTEATLATTEERMRTRFPKLDLRGTHCGYFSDDDEKRVVAKIRAAEPDVVWVGLGRPRQEAFCVRNRNALRGVAWLKTCGGLFRFLSGEVSRAPRWVQVLGMEWAHRVMLEPRRLFWRYATTNIDAIWLMARRTHDL
jgi:N-acetylglucosaminyldiphosphoundecaprenol N-acetyl-beta-D-mannosaminyltransferase